MPKFLDVTNPLSAVNYLGLPILTVKAYGATGDGVTNDRTAIQSALNAAAAAGGGVVFVPTGTYKITGGSLSIGDNVTLQGAGRAAAVLTTTDNYPVIAVASKSKVTIRDLQIAGNGDAAKTNQRGIQFQVVDSSLIDNVYVKDMGYDGLCLLSGSVNNVVSNSLVDNCEDDGINIGGSQTAESTGNVVTSNVVTNSTNVGIHISDASSYSTVSNNYITGCGSSGIDTFQSGSYIVTVGNNTIVGNTIEDCGLYGIHIRNTINNVVDGNNIEGCTFGIYAQHSLRTVFSSNTVANSTTSAFVDTADCDDLIVSNNIFVGSNCKLVCYSPRIQVSGNSIGVMSNTGNPISLAATCVEARIIGNAIRGSKDHSINILSPRTVISENVVIGPDGSVASQSCIRLTSGAHECVVSGNLIYGGYAGIQISTQDCIVSNNLLKGLTNRGLYGNGSTRAQFIGNHVTGTASAVYLTGSCAGTFITGNVTTGSTTSVVENSACTGTVLSNNIFDAGLTLSGTGAVNIPVTQTTTYTTSNVTTDRSFNANSTTVDELADVLGTLIADLKTRGIIAS